LAEVTNQVFEEIDRLDAQMSNYKPESELSVLNREAARRPVLVEPRLFQLIEDATRYSAETHGAFDPTVGPLMKLWGFFYEQGHVPNRVEIVQVLKRVGRSHLQLDREHRTLRFAESGVELDLGGIAKGYAVDQAADILRAEGITSALVSSGTSSLFALGAPPGERGWKVSVRDPYDAERAADVVWLRNHSLSVSGSYERFFKAGGKTYSHILDPRTGRPVEAMLSTAVLAPRATQADALSTAFYVLGPAGTRRYLQSHANLTVVFYQPGRSKGEYRRVVVRSPSSSLPSDSLAELDQR